MKLRKVLPVALVLILIPIVGFAFSWKSFVFWKKPEAKPLPAEREIVKDVNLKVSSNEKLKNWDKAFQSKSWDSVLKNDQNFEISQEEITYLAKTELAKQKNPPIKNLEVRFAKGELIFTGYMIKPLKGNVELRLKPKTKNAEIELKISKAKYKGIPFPKSIANKMLEKHLKPLVDFLYTYPNYRGLDINANDGYLELNFK
ncbi:hypothetical protein HN680_00875 [Candidatus Peregrinibacteria bacterium]|mgnify:CR=1 FL=1|jgi:hypothetical protein|nr:hypothetical protein [Candidatus Peregrinibacteria bacterium]